MDSPPKTISIKGGINGRKLSRVKNGAAPEAGCHERAQKKGAYRGSNPSAGLDPPVHPQSGRSSAGKKVIRH